MVLAQEILLLDPSLINYDFGLAFLAFLLSKIVLFQKGMLFN